jgi:stage II sporulation SpoE-like protein
MLLLLRFPWRSRSARGSRAEVRPVQIQIQICRPAKARGEDRYQRYSEFCAAGPEEGPSEECHGAVLQCCSIPSSEVSRDAKLFPGLTDRNFLHFSESDFTHYRKKVMTKESRNIAPQEFKDVVQLACLEVWGGNRRANHPVELPGLAGWIYSEPVAKAALGGDVHHISVCSNGIISRFALADVSGHGRSSSIMAQLLRKLIHKHINTWDQSELMRELNESLRNTKKRGEQYATAALFAYCRPTRELVFTNAGHPAAFWYHAKTDTWDWLESTTPSRGPSRGYRSD